MSRRNTNRNTNGGVSKSMKKFSKIPDYLEVHHKKVYELLEDAGMLGSLNPRRGGSITFLIPDSAYIAKIRKILDSDKAEEATDILGSLILKDMLATPKDFAEHQDDIPTLLGKKLIVKSVSANKVMIDDGELTPDDKAKFFDRKGSIKMGNLAVWNLKGEVKYADAPKTTYKYQGAGAKSVRGRKRGGGIQGGNDEQRKCEILDNLINAKVKSYSQSTPGQQETCPLLGEVAKQLRYYSANKPEIYQMARAILTGHPVMDIILIYENPTCFPTLEVLEAHEKGVGPANDVSTVKDLFDNLEASALNDKNALVATAQGQQLLLSIRDGDNGLRLKTLESSNARIGAAITKCYKELSDQNKMGTASPVYESSVHQIFQSNPHLLQLVHEFTYLLNAALETDVYTQDNVNNRANLAKSLGHIMNRFVTTYRCGDRCVFDNASKKIKLHQLGPLDGIVERDILDRFVKMWFLHLPISNVTTLLANQGICHVRYGSDESNNPDSDIIGTEEAMMEKLGAYADDAFELSPAVIGALEHFLANGGKLPNNLQQ